MAAGALREILARFGIAFDDSQLKKGDKAVDGLADKLANLGKVLAGGYVVGKLKEIVFGLAQQADALAKQAAALGVSTDQLQSWQHAAGLSGASTEEFNGALTKFNKTVADAASGTGPAAEAFRKLGISVKDGAGKLGEPIDLLEGVAAGLEKIQNPAQRTEAVMALFGRSGAKLLPLFESGADGIAKMRAEVAELGGGFSPDFAKRAEAMNDAITRLNLAWLSFKVRVGGLVIPLVERFTIMATRVTASVNRWADRTGVLGEKSNLAAAAAVVLGAAFFRAGLRAIIPWLPMIATVGAIILLVDELITLWEGGDTIIGRAIDGIFGEGASQKAVAWVKRIVSSTQELFTDTERALTEFDAGLRLLWFDLTTWVGDAWDDMGTGLTLMFIKLGMDVEYIIASIADEFSELWNSINEGIDKVPLLGKVLGKFTEAQRAGTGRREKVEEDFALANRYALDQSDARRAANARERQAIIDSSIVTRPATATAPVSNATTVTTGATNINITVPPGTPAQQARAIGAAAANGVKQGNRATRDALAHTAR